MKAKDRQKFTEILQKKKKKIIEKAQNTLETGMTLDEADLSDEMDLASSEYLQSFQFRLRGRERTFLAKIDSALSRIEDGSFGTCDDCGNVIHPKRLEARPEATLCIKCKEEQEREEQQFGD
jgi:DnaK suppressor protein